MQSQPSTYLKPNSAVWKHGQNTVFSKVMNNNLEWRQPNAVSGDLLMPLRTPSDLHNFNAEKGYLGAVKRGQTINQEEISLALRRAFQLCDQEIVGMSKSEDNWKGGTTACIALTIDRVRSP